MPKMLKILKTIALGALVVFLFSCSRTSHEDAKRACAKRACIQQCEVKKKACQKVCSTSCKQCEAEANTSMTKRYKTYVHEQCVQGERVALQLQSFRDPLQCRKTSCDCPADYRACVGACRGNIRKSLQVTPFCC
jgi:hypothetical protein